MLCNLQALFETIIDDIARDYGKAGYPRRYIDHAKLGVAINVSLIYTGNVENIY